MATPDFKHAFETWHLRSQDEIRSVLNKTIVKIIEHRFEKWEQIIESTWVQDLQAEGIDVSMLTNPCVLERVPDGHAASISTRSSACVLGEPMEESSEGDARRSMCHLQHPGPE